ncbi:NRDE family protein [Daejeonella sp.]|uniref:NRDE family protein n=1 Tax=Daejeonella sp. TaxID=2805397 RepID=UPI002731E247|nr:NRDE family protein [Daejeonella sp.]MDP2415649.1 NRDE family protein [Daejeonella sp.]
MCTVSYIPTADGIIITSNRDENLSRACVFPPSTENFGKYQLFFPKDPESAGSWIVIKNSGEVAVLLNGAFENHIKLKSYRKSRGLILLDIMRVKSPEQAFDKINLSEIENFTLLLYKNRRLLEYRWDGFQKHKESKNADIPHIWSSVTLYPHPVREQRELWFSSWLKNESDIDQQKIIQFHHSAGHEDEENGLVMKRDNNISTISISSVKINSTEIIMSHEDLKQDSIKQTGLQILPEKTSHSIVERWKTALRIIAIKIFNWEFWPMHVIYAPMYFYWVYLSARAGSLFFFSAANPGRRNAGFAMEKKSDSYTHLPQQCYPKTILCQQDTSAAKLKMMLADKTIGFPLIAKPDMGERGAGVKLIKTLEELVDYSKLCSTGFLVQDFIDYPNEVGIFYYRFPGSENGHISGIVGKEFLTLTGDGISTMESLIKNKSRCLLQLKTLRELYGNRLEEILPSGKEKVLMPYGNHCRGAKFIDLSFMISEKLTSSIDRICKQVPEFYFGRLDIKFNTWKDLENGEKFSIIELNGAASEPTHMYDPKHSIFFAWKEIKRHWYLLYKISRKNAERNAVPLMNTKEGMKMLRDHSKHIRGLSSI